MSIWGMQVDGGLLPTSEKAHGEFELQDIKGSLRLSQRTLSSMAHLDGFQGSSKSEADVVSRESSACGLTLMARYWDQF